MGWDDEAPRATTPPRGGGQTAAVHRATTPPRGGGSPPPVAPRPTAANAGFGGDMPIVIGTVVGHTQSPTSRTRLSRAGDDLSDAVDFSSLQTLRQPRPSDVVLAEPLTEIRLCGKYVPRGRAFCGIGCMLLLALCAVFVGAAIGGDADSEEPEVPVPDTWSYEDMPEAAEIPTFSVHVELELRAEISEMPEGSDQRREFETAIVVSTAALMQIPKQRVAVLSLRQGSGGRRRQLQSGAFVIAVLGIVPAAADEISASVAASALVAAVEMRNDELTGVLSSARVTASGNLLGEVGEVDLSQARPCSRNEQPDVRQLSTVLAPSCLGRLHTRACHACEQLGRQLPSVLKLIAPLGDAAQREHVFNVRGWTLSRLPDDDGCLQLRLHLFLRCPDATTGTSSVGDNISEWLLSGPCGHCQFSLVERHGGRTHSGPTVAAAVVSVGLAGAILP